MGDVVPIDSPRLHLQMVHEGFYRVKDGSLPLPVGTIRKTSHDTWHAVDLRIKAGLSGPYASLEKAFDEVFRPAAE